MNKVEIGSKAFTAYGKVIDESQVTVEQRQQMMTYMKGQTQIPEQGNVYVADFEGVDPLFKASIQSLVSGLDLQFGYCHGRNQKVNALEWHEGEEIIMAITPCVLFLGLPEGLVESEGKLSYDTKDLVSVELTAGDMIQLKNRILHFAPVKVQEDGFMTMIILPKGTNTPLEVPSEDGYLFMTNKWLIAHAERPDLVDKGAKLGLTGINYDWSTMK